VQHLEDREHQNPLDIGVHQELARLFESGGEIEKAKRQYEMAYMLQKYGKQARRGLSALNSATGLSVSGDAKTAPEASAPSANAGKGSRMP
jgi:hypothetical protein